MDGRHEKGQQGRGAVEASQLEQGEGDHREAHERDRIGDEHGMVVHPVLAIPAPVQEQQPDERDRERDQRPGEFVGV